VNFTVSNNSISNITKQLSGEEYTGSEATASKLAEALTESGVNILRILSHVSFTDNEPLNRSIHLANETKISAREILALEPKSPYPFHTTLICCESGVVSHSRGSDEMVLDDAIWT